MMYMIVYNSLMSLYVVIVLCCLVYIYCIYVWFLGYENFIMRLCKLLM